MSSEEKSDLLRALAPLLAFGCAALFGLWLVPFFARGAMGELLASPEYRTWQAMLVLQAALWILGWCFVGTAWRSGVEFLQNPWLLAPPVALMGILIVLPGVLFESIADKPDFTRCESKAAPIVPLPILFGVPASLIVSAGIFRINAIAREWMNGDDLPMESDFRNINSQLERHLLILGAILAGAVLGSDACFNAFKSIDGESFLREGEAWFYAIYWSVLIASIYIAPKIALRRVGVRMVQAAVPQECDIETTMKLEKTMNERLGLDQGYVAQLQSAFGIVAPIAGAIASNLLQ